MTSDESRGGNGATSGAGIHRLSTVSIADRAAGELLRLIKTELRTGDKLLAEPDLARELGVGRSTVREAKQMLISRGFLEARGKVGTFVADADHRKLPLEMLEVLLTERRMEELHQARNILEVGAIRLSSLQATEAELKTLEDLLADAGGADSDEEFWAGTVGFHEALVRTCHNTAVCYMYDSLSEAMRSDQLPIHARENDRQRGTELHRRLVSALRTRNPDAAAAAMTDHLSRSHHHDQSVLRRDHERDAPTRQ